MFSEGADRPCRTARPLPRRPLRAARIFPAWKPPPPTKDAISLQLLLAFLFTALYWAWIFSTYATEALIVPLEGSLDANIVLKVSGLFGAALFLFAAWRGWRMLSTPQGMASMKMLPLPLGLAAAILAIAQHAFGAERIPFALGVAAWISMGLGTGASFVHLGVYSADVEPEKLSPLAAAAVIASGLVYMGIANMEDPASSYAVGTIALLTWAVGIATSRSWPARSKKLLDDAKTEGSSRAFKRQSVEFLLYSTVFGLAQCIGVTLPFGSVGHGFLWLAFCTPGLFLAAYHAILDRYLSVDTVMRVLLSFVAFALLPLPFMEATGRAASCALLIFGFTSYDILRFCSLESAIRAEGLHPFKYFALGRFANAFGVMLGWIIGGAVLAEGDLDEGAFTAICLGCVLFLVLVLTFVQQPASTPTQLEAERGGRWRRSCDAIADEAGFSPREREVFELLSRGRDAERIGDALFISVHTVKTHIQHIYKKLDVHSQQRIIDLVEQKSAERRDEAKKKPPR